MKGKELVRNIWLVIGAVVVTLALAAGVVALLYWLTGEAGEDGARWWAVAATLALPAAVVVTYRMATHAAREHLSGFDRGLYNAEKTFQHVGRGMNAAASLARADNARSAADRRSTQQTGYDDLLPKLGQMQLSEAQSGGDVVDL